MSIPLPLTNSFVPSSSTDKKSVPQGPSGITTGFSDLLIGYEVSRKKAFLRDLTDELEHLISNINKD